MKLKFLERIDKSDIIIVIAAIVIICLLVFTAIMDESECPKFEYMQDVGPFIEKNKTFFLEKGYVLNEGHYYDIVKKEDGYDMVFHFVEDTQ